jgi:hypothetical protein
MKNWHITGFLAILTLGFLLMSGCVSTAPTSTAVSTPTPQIVYVTVTVTPTPTPSPSPVSKTVLFSDDLSKWHTGWSQESETSNGKIFYSGGSLHIRDNHPPTESKWQGLDKYFNDFILEVDTKTIDGTIDNWQGVYFRIEDGEDNYYGAAVSADGYYGIQKWVNGDVVVLAGPARSSYINTGIGATNRIRVEANKNALSLSVNGNHLRTVTDNSFKEGSIGLTADCLSSGPFTEVVFNNLVITTV